MPDVIKFSYNWNNKLAGRMFTTLRLKDVRKYRHGETYDIHLKKGKETHILCKATIVEMRHIHLADINEFIAGVDTGYSAEECKELIRTMYKNSNINWDTQLLSFILLRKETKSIEQKPVFHLEEETV